ncbi:rRNA methyltransferase 1, mitochondrial [Ceratocystis lukuohia]|uniref:rRNA methyltransferase 1, mitochondrial n=1 Tax=Ceratocystis lukuohia TaxID=2019550 RepID=A0ABR4MAR6_9PEZI
MSSMILLQLARRLPRSHAVAPLIPGFSQERAASSFSAIHRGVRASSKATGRSFTRHDRTDRMGSRGSGSDKRRKQDGPKVKENGRMSDADFRKAMTKDGSTEEESSRRSRRSRFHDAEEGHGKRSLVYMMKYGPLKETADRILAQKAAEATAASRKALGLPLDESKTEKRNAERPLRGAPSLGRPAARDIDHKGTSFGDKRWQSPFEKRGDSSDRPQRPLHEQNPDKSPFDRRSRDSSLGDRAFSGRSFGHGRERDSRPSTSFSARPQRDRSVYGSSRSRYDDPKVSNLQDSRGSGQFRRTDKARNFDSPASRQDRGPAIIGSPVVPYTTAASQFIFGKSAVKAALHANRRKMYKLYVYNGDNRKDSPDDALFIALAKQHGIAWELVPTNGQPMMDRMSQGRPHNGYILEASPLPQPPIMSLGKCSTEGSHRSFEVKLGYQTREEQAINGTGERIVYASLAKPKPLVLLLHELLDPGNLGGIIRTAHFMGIAAIAITKHSTATLTPVVIKAAAGAAEHMPVLVVENPTLFVEESQRAGWRTFAAVAPDSRNHSQSANIDVIAEMNPLNEYPSILVLGSEGSGIPRHLRKRIDVDVTIPRLVPTSQVDSLNVSVATGLLCHAFMQKRPGDTVQADPVAEAMGMSETTMSVEAVTSALASAPEPLDNEKDADKLF